MSVFLLSLLAADAQAQQPPDPGPYERREHELWRCEVSVNTPSDPGGCGWLSPIGLDRIFLQGGNSIAFTKLIRVAPGGLPARSPFGTSYLTDVPMHEVAIYVDDVRMMR